MNISLLELMCCIVAPNVDGDIIYLIKILDTSSHVTKFEESKQI